MARGGSVAASVVLVALAVASAADLHRVEARTLVLYTTPALRDFLEGSAIPAFTGATGVRAVALYLSAGEEVNRLRVAPDRPEADLLLFAAPLWIEQAYAEGLVEATAGLPPLAANHTSRAVPGGHLWTAFAWSPVVEVVPGGAPLPDLAQPQGRLAVAHPVLSSNGAYTALLYQEAAAAHPGLQARLLAHTVVQPVNSRATIGALADRSVDMAVGYEAVAAYYRERGADIGYGVPILDGARVTLPVLFSAALVRHHPHEGAERFLQLLLSEAAQQALSGYWLRPVLPGVEPPASALDLAGTRMLAVDWSGWQDIRAVLPLYEVRR